MGLQDSVIKDIYTWQAILSSCPLFCEINTLFYLVVPSQPPAITRAVSTTSTTIYLEWTEVTQLNPANSTLLGYGIVYKKRSEIFQIGFLKSVSPAPLEATLEDLEKFTNYVIRVFAFTDKGNGVSSQPVSLRTQEDGKVNLIFDTALLIC